MTVPVPARSKTPDYLVKWLPHPEFPGGNWRLVVQTPGGGRAGYVDVATGRPDVYIATGVDPRPVARVIGDALTRYARHGDLRPPTSVWSVRGMTPDQAAALGIVYCGRAHRSRDGLGRAIRVVYPDHPLRNPVRCAQKAPAVRRANVAGYRAYLRGSPELVALARSLRGSRLGCWCGDFDGIYPTELICHCVEIAKVAEGID